MYKTDSLILNSAGRSGRQWRGLDTYPRGSGWGGGGEMSVVS